MSRVSAAIRRRLPEIADEQYVGELDGRWVGTPDNQGRNQFGSVLLTDRAAYVYKRGSIFNPESVYRIPMAAAHFDVKRNPGDTAGRTLIMWLDEVPTAEAQKTYLAALARNDFQAAFGVRRSAHRFLAFEREGVQLSLLIRRAVSLWMEHPWREQDFGSRLEFDRSMNAAGSAIPLSQDEVEKVRVLIKSDGLTRQEAQGRILDEREARQHPDRGTHPQAPA